MSVRKQVAKPAPQKKTEEQVEPAKADVALEETDKLLSEIDELLDDIVGESTAQEFVGSFVQKGGQ